MALLKSVIAWAFARPGAGDRDQARLAWKVACAPSGIETDLALVEVGERLRQMTLRAQEIGAPEVRGGVIGIDHQGLIEVCQRQIVLVHLPVGEGAIDIGGGEIGIDLYGVAEVVDRVLVVTDPGVGGAARVVGCRIIGVSLNDVAERGDIYRACAGLIRFDFRDMGVWRRSHCADGVASGERQRGDKGDNGALRQNAGRAR